MEYKPKEADSMANNMLLKYHNDLNQVTLKGLTARESNVFFALCAIMKDHGLDSLTLTFDRLKTISNITVADESELVSIIKETYQKLIRVAAYYETDTTFGGFILFDRFEGNLLTRTVTISVNPKFAYMINELTQNFTVMELKEFTEIQSTYTKILYRQLQQFKKTGIYIVELDYFRHILDVPESYDMRKVTQKILNPSIDTLRKIFKDLAVEKIREGRFIKRLKFTFTPFAKTTSFESDNAAGVSVSYLDPTDIKGTTIDVLPKAKRGRPKKIESKEISKKQPQTKDESMICPSCHKALIKIKRDDGTIFYGHQNWKEGPCSMTYSSIDDIQKMEQEIKTNIEEQVNDFLERGKYKKEIITILSANKDILVDIGDNNNRERIVVFHRDGVARKIPYTKLGLEQLQTFIKTITAK